MNIGEKILAQCDPIIGCVTPPDYIKRPSAAGDLTPLLDFLNNFLKLIFIAAGLWAFINLIMAGFGYMTAGGDPKQLTKAWDRIWQSLLGLLIIVSSFLIAAIMGILLFKDPLAILRPKL